MGNTVVTPRARPAAGSVTKFRPSPIPESQARKYGYGFKCCLIVRGSEAPLPLKKVDVNVKIIETLSEINVVHAYKNDQTVPVETSFVFSVGDNAVLSSLKVVVGDKTLTAEIQEKEEAFATYDDSISAGNGAYLLESTEKSNQYKLFVGNMPPGAEAEVHFTYIAPVPLSHQGLIFTLPDTLFPKHNGYKCSIKGNIKSSDSIQALECRSDHSIIINKDNLGWSYEPNDAQFGIQGEFVLAILTDNPAIRTENAATKTIDDAMNVVNAPSLVLERHPEKLNSFAALIDFKPIFSSNFPENASDYEFVVLCDCGGSMYGSKMNSARNALQLLVHSLPQGSKFNFVSVGSYHSKLWPRSVVLDDDNLKKSLWHIDHLNANMGDTVFRSPLQDTYLTRDLARNLVVFVLTSLDYCSETRELVKVIQSKANSNSRLFTIGFGDEVDSDLLSALAFAGKGRAHQIKEGELVDAVIFQQLVTAFAPRVRDIKVHWNLPANGKLIEQTPERVPITAFGNTTQIFGLLEMEIPENQAEQQGGDKNAESSEDKQSEQADKPADDQKASKGSKSSKHKKTGSKGKSSKRPDSSEIHLDKFPLENVTITALGPNDSPLSWVIPTSDSKVRSGSMLHSYAAFNVCKEFTDKVRTTLMSDAQVKSRVIEISTKYQVLSKYTSFIAVEERKGQGTTEAMKNVHIPSADLPTAESESALPAPPPPPIFVPPTIHRPHPVPRPGPRLPVRHFHCTKHWTPPAAPISIQQSAPNTHFVPTPPRGGSRLSFASDKAKKKKSSASDSIAASPRAQSSISKSSAYSALGFSLGDNDDASEEEEYEHIDEKRLLTHYARAAPEEYIISPPVKCKEKEQSKSDEDLKQRKRELSNLSAAPPAALKTALIDDPLTNGSLAPPPPPPSASEAPKSAPGQSISLEMPADWDFAESVVPQSKDLVATLRAIVTSQHANGSWSTKNVCQFLSIESSALSTSNPLKEKKASKAKSTDAKDATPKKKSKSKTASSVENKENLQEGDATSKPSSSSEVEITTDKSTAEPKKADETQAPTALSVEDIWATVVLYAYLQAKYLQNREFWIFVALKIENMLREQFPEEEARQSLIKTATKYVAFLK